MGNKLNERRRAVFLDRDGVLNVDSGYVYRPSDLRLVDGVPQALMRLKDAGYLLIVVTNQSGVARGLYSTADVETFHQALILQILTAGGPAIDEFYYCPHHEQGTVSNYAVSCSCRKPQPGMIQDAAQKYGIDLARSFMVGDKADDIEAALRAGVRGIQVRGSYGSPHTGALAVVGSLAEAVPLILAKSGH